MAQPSAYRLWQAYPFPPDRSPCSDGYTNQCAIRMSIALEKCGVDLARYPGNKCTHGHARGAQGLASYLKRIWGQPTWTYRRNRDRAASLLQAHNGLIFFKNCFTRSGESTREGDHIDVWFFGKAQTYEDFTGSDEVWFWKLALV